MYSLDELKSWWEVPAIAHFFSLFKSCFSLTDFTIEELEQYLLVDGQDDKATSFTSRLLAELLQGCYANPSISLGTYHESLIHIMKLRWEEEDGRVNPLSSINADFHSLPTLLKVQIIHRLTEYRLDAKDVEEKLNGLNPSDLRLEPLGIDRNGSKYWYFFGVRLYKETPPPAVKKSKKKKHEGKMRKKESKKPKLHSGTISKAFLKLVSGERIESEVTNYVDPSIFPSSSDTKKKNKKSKKKHKTDANIKYSDLQPIGRSKWEIVCYDVDDWETLAKNLKGSDSFVEESLCRLITDNFLPNLPKIVYDMENQRINKANDEKLTRRTSCRLLAKKLYEEEDGINFKHIESLKKVEEEEESEETNSKQRAERMELDFKRMVDVELKRKRKESYARWKKEREERKKRRLSQGLPLESESSSDESIFYESLLFQSRLQSPVEKDNQVNKVLTTKSSMPSPQTELNFSKEDKVPLNRRGRPPFKGLKDNIQTSLPKKSEGKSKKEQDNVIVQSAEDEIDKENDPYLKTAQDHEYDVMKKSWEMLDTHPEAWPFQKPVEEWYAPGYHEIIEKPIDLSFIEMKLIERKYSTVREFSEDIILMFSNCRLYNGPDNEYSELADSLEKLFQRSLRNALTKKKKTLHSSVVRKKPGRPRKYPAKDSTLTETPILPPQFPDIAYSEMYIDSNDDPTDEESSDEFTPAGVSKSKLRRSRSESVGRGRPPGTRGRGRGRGRGRPPSNPGVKSSRNSSNESNSKSSDSSSKEEENKLQPTPPIGRGRGRGRGRGGKRGRPPLKRSSISHNDNNSDSGTSDNCKKSSIFTQQKRGRGRGRPKGSRGRGRPSSTSNVRPSNDSSSESEESENNSESDDSVKDRSDDEKKSAANIGSPSNKPDDKTEMPAQVYKSSMRDPDTSSSSSRASSRSHSPEKSEKQDDVSKTKPLFWSLDYLASQARVLDEQHKQNEANTVASLNKKQHILNKSDQNNKFPSDVPMQKHPLQFPRYVDRDKLVRKYSSDNPSLSSSPPGKSHQPLNSKQEKIHDTAVKCRNNDIYNFKEESPSTFSKKTNELQQTNPSPAVANPLKTNTVDANSLPKPTSIESPGINDRTTEAANDHRIIAASKNRHISYDQLSSPTTPSSGYGSARTASTVGQMSYSPYSASDNSVGLSKSAEKHSPVKPTSTDPPKSLSADPTTLPLRHSASEDRTYSGRIQNSNQPVLDESQVNKPTDSIPPSPHFKDKPPGPMNRPVNAMPAAQPGHSHDERSSNTLSKPLPWSQQQNHSSNSSATVPGIAARRTSQSTITNQTSLGSPGYQQCNPSPGSSAPVNAMQKSSQPPVTARHHSSSNASIPPTTTPQHTHGQRLPSYGSQSANPNFIPAGDTSQRVSKTQIPTVNPQPAQSNFERRLSNARSENYRSPGSSGSSVPMQQSPYGFNSSSSTSNSIVGNLQSRDTPAYHAIGTNPPTSTGVSMISQTPTMANFGLTPQSLTQPHHEDSSGRGPGPVASSQPSQRRSSIPAGQANYQSAKVTAHPSHLQNQQGGSLQQRSSRYHNASSSTSQSSVNQQHNQSASATAAHHPTPKNRSTSVGGSESSNSKHLSRQSSSSNHHSVQSTSGSATNRRQSNTTAAQYQQKHAVDYPNNYLMPSSSTATQREVRASYGSHQQNGLLSAAAGTVPGMHQDLTASATLRALQQQHKADRPSSHAAASMFHYAAAAAQQTQVANEQYNRLAASAHRHVTSQHGHPLAGVYHPHHQNVSTTSPHQSATHLGNPWLPATAGNPAAGYPSNFIPPHHMDPVYHLMQQTGIHGQMPIADYWAFL